jgi:N-acetylglucosamine-6-sulfatase
VPSSRVLRVLLLVAALLPIQWALRGLDTKDPAARAEAQTPAPTEAASPAPGESPARPNIVLIVTDDQRWDTLWVMPEVRRLLAQEGMTFQQAFVTNPLCCPSRATILTGGYSHTTGVYFNRGPYGGWQSFKPSESATIATALDALGYRTALIGKYLNGYTGDGLYVPPGWDRWFAFAQTNGDYYDYRMLDNANGLQELSFGTEPRDYSTDVLRRKAAAFIRGTPPGKPFFLMVTPYAPHGPPVEAPRHQGHFGSPPVPSPPSLNEPDVSDKPSYLREQDLIDPTRIRRLIREQWETLFAVDQLVLRIDRALRETGRWRDTLVIFTSDNGVANGEHRWGYKLDPHDESIRVPLIVRFPALVPAGIPSDALVSNVDIAATIADFAGAPFASDGVSMRRVLTGTGPVIRRAVLLEHLQYTSPVPSYCGVRTLGYMFVRYGTGEEELYDVRADPYQLENVASTRRKKAAELRRLTKTLCVPTPPGYSW